MADPRTVTIEIITGHCLGGADNNVYPGDRLEAPGRISIEAAEAKVRMGYARFVESHSGLGGVAIPPSGPEAVLHRDPVIDSRDPMIQGVAAAAPQKVIKGRSRGTGGRNSK